MMVIYMNDFRVPQAFLKSRNKGLFIKNVKKQFGIGEQGGGIEE